MLENNLELPDIEVTDEIILEHMQLWEETLDWLAEN